MDIVTKKVIEKLKNYEMVDYNTLRPHTQKILNEIESYMSHVFEERLKAINTLKNQKININKIIENTSVSKGTIYNNSEILKKYIDKSISIYGEIEKKEYPHGKDEYTLNLNTELNKKIEKLTVALIDISDIKSKNEKLIKENNDLTDQIEKLKDTINDLRNVDK